MNSKLSISRHGALYTATFMGWSTTTDTGVNTIAYLTGCCVFTSNNKCDLHFDFECRDNFGNNANHTHAINMDSVKAMLSMSSLTFATEQTTAQVFMGTTMMAEYGATLAGLKTILISMNYAYNENMSHLRFTQDGRLTRMYIDSSGTHYGNLMLNGATFRFGNIVRVNIYGANYS